MSRCLKNDKPVIVVCGVNRVTQDIFDKKYPDSSKIKVFDLTSQFGKYWSINDTADCLEKLV